MIANQIEKYKEFDLPIFSDVIPNAGALGGLYTALQRGGAARTLCVACDMPFLNPLLLRYLIDQCIDCDAVVPLVEGTPHGFHAVYRQACLPIMRAKILCGDLAIHRVFPQVRTEFISSETLRSFDAHLQSLANLNTPADVDLHHALVTAKLLKSL